MPKPVPTLAALAALHAADGRTVYQLAADAGLERQTVGNLLSAATGGKTLGAVEALGQALGYRLAWVPVGAALASPGAPPVKPRRRRARG